MVIAVNTRLLAAGTAEETGNFIYETFRRIAALHPEHSFLFIFDRPWKDDLIFAGNVQCLVLSPKAVGPVASYIWHNIKLPLLLKKYKADVFVSPGGYCSLTTKIPQCLVVHDMAFLQDRSVMKKSKLLLYKKWLPRFIKKSVAVATTSVFIKDAIVKAYNSPPGKIDVIYSGTSDLFSPIEFEERENTKTLYAGSNEYFIYTGDIGLYKNLLNLLKAFSAFKKRQKSKMWLVIAGNPGRDHHKFQNELRLFRFKEEVRILESPPLSSLVSLTASAYAMVYPSSLDGFGIPALQGMKSDIPVITSAGSAMQEICGDAALYADVANFKDIAVKMMLLFKDENLRNTLIDKGRLRAKKFSWDVTAGLLWKAIERSAGSGQTGS
jgi:glycosyltransferase involved in cell wall biosynthesis